MAEICGEMSMSSAAVIFSEDSRNGNFGKGGEFLKNGLNTPRKSI